MGREAGVNHKLLEDLLLKQYRVIARSQALACGITDSGLRYRMRTGGPWQKLLPGVYLALNGAITPDHREMAALLHAGREA